MCFMNEAVSLYVGMDVWEQVTDVRKMTVWMVCEIVMQEQIGSM